MTFDAGDAGHTPVFVSAAKSSSGGGIDLPTLAITALASAGAAYVCSKVWAPGTLGAAATMPVLVALLKEGLARPADIVTRAVPVRGIVRSAAAATDEPPDPPDAVARRVAQQGEIAGASQPGRRRAWQVAIVTGLLGFVVAALMITVPEFVAGGSASGGGRETTLFGGQQEERTEREPPTTTTTPAGTVTAPPAETVTVPAPAATTTAPPATTVPPATTEPAPPAETPPPPAETVPVPPPPG